MTTYAQIIGGKLTETAPFDYQSCTVVEFLPDFDLPKAMHFVEGMYSHREGQCFMFNMINGNWTMTLVLR